MKDYLIRQCEDFFNVKLPHVEDVPFYGKHHYELFKTFYNHYQLDEEGNPLEIPYLNLYWDSPNPNLLELFGGNGNKAQLIAEQWGGPGNPIYSADISYDNLPKNNQDITYLEADCLKPLNQKFGFAFICLDNPTLSNLDITRVEKLFMSMRDTLDEGGALLFSISFIDIHKITPGETIFLQDFEWKGKKAEVVLASVYVPVNMEYEQIHQMAVIVDAQNTSEVLDAFYYYGQGNYQYSTQVLNYLAQRHGFSSEKTFHKGTYLYRKLK